MFPDLITCANLYFIFCLNLHFYKKRSKINERKLDRILHVNYDPILVNFIFHQKFKNIQQQRKLINVIKKYKSAINKF